MLHASILQSQLRPRWVALSCVVGACLAFIFRFQTTMPRPTWTLDRRRRETGPGGAPRHVATDPLPPSPRVPSETAIAVRVKNPLTPRMLARVAATAKALQLPAMRGYDLWLLSDETRRNDTARVVREHFARRGWGGDIPPPRVFPVSEAMMRAEYPALMAGYWKSTMKRSKSGKSRPGECCSGMMWQLNSLASFAAFMHHHDYASGWVLEADISTVGPYSLAELCQRWDRDLAGADVGFAAIPLYTNGCPWSKFARDIHTRGFREMLDAMGMYRRQRLRRNWTAWDAGGPGGGPPAWTQEMRRGDRRAPPREAAGNDTAPDWACVSESLYRHSREFSEYAYGLLRRNVYAFGERFQQPVALSGGFRVVDLRDLSAREGRGGEVSGLDNLGVHTAWSQNMTDQFLASDRVTTHVYHDDFRGTAGRGAEVST